MPNLEYILITKATDAEAIAQGHPVGSWFVEIVETISIAARSAWWTTQDGALGYAQDALGRYYPCLNLRDTDLMLDDWDDTLRGRNIKMYISDTLPVPSEVGIYHAASFPPQYKGAWLVMVQQRPTSKEPVDLLSLIPF